MRATIAGQLLNLTPTFDPPQQGQQATDANTERKIAMASRIERAAGGKLAGKSVAVLGVTFKSDTDDVRDAPSLTLIPMLQEKGASVRAYDPHARENAEELLPGVIWCGSALEAAEKADIAVVVTEWSEFRALDLNTLKGCMRGDVLVDLRNIYCRRRHAPPGSTTQALGRRTTLQVCREGLLLALLAMPHENRITVNVALQLQQLQYCSASRSTFGQ